MFRCHVCGKTESRQELVSEVFDIEGKPARLSKFLQRSACIAANQCSPATQPSEFGAWFMEKRNLSSRFRWTYSPTGNPFCSLSLKA
jgi:hypothetical protein